MMKFIEVFSKEKFLEISKLVWGEDFFETDDEYLFYLPDGVFGSELKVDTVTGIIIAYGKDLINWEVPPYFVKRCSCVTFGGWETK